MPNLVPLCFRYLAEMDRGRIDAVFQRHVEAVRDDIMDRPTDAAGKPHKRKIIIEIELEPEVQVDPEGGGMRVRTINGDVQIKSKVPVHRSAPVAFAIARGGQLVFNPDIPGPEGLFQPSLPGTGHESEMDDDE